jgi:hypothetical protein
MCGVNNRLEVSKTPPRPRWSGLYLLAGLMLGVLLGVQALVAAGAERTALQCGLVLAGFAAMVQWAHRNRAALDHLDWCDCASSRVTVRVISSSREAASLTPADDAQSWVDAEPAESLEEIAR